MSQNTYVACIETDDVRVIYKDEGKWALTVKGNRDIADTLLVHTGRLIEKLRNNQTITGSVFGNQGRVK